MPYYCETHNKMWRTPDQWRGHWTSAHREELPLISAGQALVDEFYKGIPVIEPTKKIRQQVVTPLPERSSFLFIIPLLDNECATFKMPRPMTESEWRQMMAVLSVMKVGLVRGE